MTDRARQRDEASGGDGRRRRVRVTVGGNGADEPSVDEPSVDVPTVDEPATAVTEGSAVEPDEVADTGTSGAAEGVSDEMEALVAEACIAELAKAETERDLYLDQLQRLKAEFDNYRKRLQREGEALRLRAAEGLVESLLPVVDNMERALEAAGKHEESRLVEGVELVSGQLRSVLASQGLEEVPAAPGVPFDPTVHEAVLAQESDDHPEGTIVAVLEKGYLLHGRLLRPVKVIVAR
jgi:molecular chaperone GrpE